MCLVRSVGCSVYVRPVAEEIAAPLARHWYERDATGDHVPGSAVRTRPTLSVPLMVGVGEAAKAPAPTGAVGALVAVMLLYPSRTAVTRSVIGWPNWAEP